MPDPDTTLRQPSDTVEKHEYPLVTTADGSRLTPAIELLPDAVVVVDEGFVLRYANDAAANILGWQPGDFSDRQIADLVHPDDIGIAAASMESILAGQIGELIRIRIRTGGGDWAPLEIRGTPQRTAGGDTVVVLVCRDTTARHLLDLDGGEVAVLRSVMANMHGMVAIIEPDLAVRSVNGAFTRRLGHHTAPVRSRPFVELLHPDDRDDVIDAIVRLAPHESVGLDARFATSVPDGGALGGSTSKRPPTGMPPSAAPATDDEAYITCEFTVNNLTTDPVLGGYIISGQISPALSDARDRVDFLAEHDNLTGLRNRTGFMKRALDMLRHGGGLGLLLIDVTQFRSINELYGERVGDRVLASLAARIDEIRSPDLVTARFGGDEFVIAVRSSGEAEIHALRERIRRDIALPVVVEGQDIHVALRTAIAFEPAPQALESLLASASNELMRAKRNADPETGGITFDAINERRRQLDQLRGALESGEIQPYFQPIVAVDGEVTAFEALVRWVHPVRGLLGVNEILPLAQMAGLMQAIDNRVLDESFRFARRLTADGFGHVEVHVNVDPKVIAQPAFATSFLHRCELAGADATQIVIEITETDLLAPGVASLDNMRELRRAGCHVSIDDFGTGYSSLAHLLELPVDGVKIDKRFVAGIDVDSAATNLTTAILGLSESLRLGCVAEGVEQPYQRDRLAAMGCNAFQGWLFSRAVAADDALGLLPRLDAVPARVS